ncbi:MAG TPA: hypothetical protein VFL10_01510 [Ornithinibacter sp.]|nr:hypothetical protein [Ornithinibacter sp.]
MSDGVIVRRDPGALHRLLDAADLPHLDFIEHVFLPDALAKGCVTPQEEHELERLLGTLRAQATHGAATTTPAAVTPTPVVTEPVGKHVPAARPAVPAVPAVPPGPPGPPGPPVSRSLPTSMPRPLPPSAATPVPRPERTASTALVTGPRPRSARALWWDRTREAIGSDLAVHGLAYVGVLLFFVGAFGLVVFAFGDVELTLRPVAELVIALAPFAAAALLLRRGATVVGRALEVAGGLLVPVMLITGFLDDYSFPPDLYGVELAVALTVLTSLVAVAYAAWSWRHPQSALRYLVAPVAWLAVGMATLGLGERDIPDGKAVATPGAAQCAAILAALVVTVALARLRPTNLLSRPTRVAAVPGLVVIASMSLLSWAAEGWPLGPVLATGALVVAALELLAAELPPMVVALVEPLWWFLVWAALATGAPALPPDVPTGSVAVLAAVGVLGILELAGAARRPALAHLLPALGLAAALIATMADARSATVAFAAASVWAAGRRMVPYAVRGATVALDLATALLPALALASLVAATSAPVALLTGSLVVLLSTVPARRGGLGRTPDDRYWATWWTAAGAAVLTLTTSAWLQPDGWSTREVWLLVVGFGVLTVAAALGPLSVRWRPPVVTAVATLTWVSAAAQLDASALALATPPAMLALALVIAAHASTPPTSPRPGRRASIDPASLGLTGHALGLVAIPLASVQGWAPVIAVALATAGFAVTGWLDTGHRSPVGSALAHLPVASWIPLSLTAVGIPVTLVLGLDRAGAVSLDGPRSVYVVVATAVAYAALSRLPLPGRVVVVAGWAGFIGALVATVAADSRVGTMTGLAAVPVVTVLVRPHRRPRLMTWVSWAVAAPLVGLLATETWPWFDALPDERAVAFTLATVGAVLLVGAAAADLRGRSWVPRLLPTHPWALPPAAVGAADVVLGLLVAATLLPADPSGWVFATAATTALVTAVLSRVGARAAVAVVLGWAAVLLLVAPQIEARPWIAALVTLGLLAAAELLSAPSAVVPWWARWDDPLLVSAVPVASTALVLSAGTSSAAVTFTAVGAECVAVASWLRKRPLVAVPAGCAGTVLVLVGAGTAGPGWLALALLGLSAGLTGIATRAHGVRRTALQVSGAVAAVGAWRVASNAWDLSDQRAVELAATGAALVVVAAVAAAIATRVDRSWVLVWGGTATVVAGICGFDVVAPEGLWREVTHPSLPVAAGLAVVATALSAAPRRLRIGWLPDLAVAYGLGALLVGMMAAGIGVRTRVVVLCLVTVASAMGALLLSRGPGRARWLRPVVEAGVATALWAFALGLFATSGTMLLAPVLAASAVLAAAVGTAYGRVFLEMASPVLACGAWLVFSTHALDGNPQWVTVPIGLATLVVVALWRRDRRAHGGRPAAPEIVVLELVGIAFLVGAALVQAVTESVAYAVLATAIGLAVAGWGVVSRVRRRVAAGVGIVLVGVVLLVGVPLWNLLLPAWDAAVLWVLIGLAGIVALLVAGTIDWSRATARRGLTRVEEATADWE